MNNLSGNFWSGGGKEARAAKLLGLGLMGLVVIAFLPTLLAVATNVVLLIVTCIVGVTLVSLGPLISKWLTMKGANFLLRFMKDEAVNNPIETMQNNLQNRAEELRKAGDELTTLTAQVKTFETELKKHKQQFPDEDSADMDSALTAMKGAVNVFKGHYDDARVALEEYSRKIKMAESKWRLAQTGNAIFKRLNPQGRNEMLNRILEEVAMRSVEENFNASIARLQVSMNDAGTIFGKETGGVPRALPETTAHGPVIDITEEPVARPQKVGVAQ